MLANIKQRGLSFHHTSKDVHATMESLIIEVSGIIALGGKKL